MTLPPDSAPPNGAAPGQPSDGDALKAALRDVLGDLLPQFERHVLEQVDARIAERNNAADPSSLIPQVVESLRPMVTEQINSVAARLQGQIDQAAAQLQGAGRPVQAVNAAQGGASAQSPSAPADKVDKVVSATREILAMVDTLLDGAVPKLLSNYTQWKMAQSPWLHDMNALAMLKQQDPLRAAVMGQILSGPNPYEQVIPQAMLNGAMWGMKIKDTVKGGATWQPNSPGQPSPSAGPSVAPSSSSPTQPGQTLPAGSGVNMSEMQQTPAQPNGARPTTPVLRVLPAPKASAPGTGPANGTQAPRRKSLAEAMEG